MFAQLDSGAVATAVSAGVVVNKCSQIANGGLYHDAVKKLKPGNIEDMFAAMLPQQRTWEHIHNAKTEAVADLANELQGSPLLVAYDYLHDLDRLQKVFGKDLPYIGGGVPPTKSKKIENDWNAGKLRVLAGQWQSTAHGLNLQSGPGHHIFLYSLTYNYELFTQLVARLQRQGSKHSSIFLHICVASKTVDEVKLRALRDKRKGMDGLLAALKDYRKSR
jgi:hypothetical protein